MDVDDHLPNEISDQLNSSSEDHSNPHTSISSESQPSTSHTLPSNPTPEGPSVGMEFHSEAHAYDYYNAYGKSAGFSIRRSKMVMRKDKTITRRVFCCSKEGFRCKHPRGDPMRPRPETRTGCGARMGIHLEGGKYVVNEFVHEHNHSLAPQVHKLSSQRKNQDSDGFCIEDIMAYLGQDGGMAPPHELNLVDGDANKYLQRWCYEILKRSQEDKKKIRELTAELQRERRQSATYREQLNIVLKEMEDHTNHLSKQVEDIVYSMKEFEPLGSKGIS